MEKLTDEELSRVLSEQSVGRLNHSIFYSDFTECGCVAGAAMNIERGAWMDEVPGRAQEISERISVDPDFEYPTAPEALLQMLADRDLA